MDNSGRGNEGSGEGWAQSGSSEQKTAGWGSMPP